MTFQSNGDSVRWRLHLVSSPERVYEMLSTDSGRARFWAESATVDAGTIVFRFPGGETWRGRILEQRPHALLAVEYYGGSVATFTLEPDGTGGTDLTLTDDGVATEHHAEVTAGWVSVLLTLKAAVDHSVDLRNHDPHRTWDHGYADN